MEEEILSCDFDKYEKNILTPNWITEYWRFLKQCDATIETTGTWKPLRGSKGYIALIEVFANKIFTAKEIKDINRCRMYLQAFYLWDIADIAGQYIETWAIKGKRDGTRHSKWEWSIQQQPQLRHGRHGIRRLKKEEDITHHLGEYYDEGGHQQTDWQLNSREGTLYRCKEGK
jgi:hypothetical protein